MFSTAVLFLLIFAFRFAQGETSISGAAHALLLTGGAFCCLIGYAWVRDFTFSLDKSSGSGVIAFGVGLLVTLASVFYDASVLKDSISLTLWAVSGIWLAVNRSVISKTLARTLPLTGRSSGLLRHDPPQHLDDILNLKLAVAALFFLPMLARLYWGAWS